MREFEKKLLHDHPPPVPPPTKHIIENEGMIKYLRCVLYLLMLQIQMTLATIPFTDSS